MSLSDPSLPSLRETTRYLLDANILLALPARSHVHHGLVRRWFYASPDLRWSMCALTEAGFVRKATATRIGQLTMAEATAVLEQLVQHPGYRYLPIDADWQTLCGPFFGRLHGPRQVPDAYLLGLAVREGLVLVTMDNAIVHLARSEYGKHVLVLKEAGR